MCRVLLFISVFLCINGQCVTWTVRADLASTNCRRRAFARANAHTRERM